LSSTPRSFAAKSVLKLRLKIAGKEVTDICVNGADKFLKLTAEKNSAEYLAEARICRNLA